MAFGLAFLFQACGTELVPLGALNASVDQEERSWKTCGNGSVDEGEACDDGANDSCGECNADCSGPGGAPVCGDGEVCLGAESCDDGFNDDCGTCNADCTGPGTGSTCGDGVVCPETEVCDDGDLDNCNECDNRCRGPGQITACAAVTDDTFDPNRVYIWGSLSENSCDRDAIAHWASPKRFVVGFDCDALGRTSIIQPVEGRLLYQRLREEASIRAFSCDKCPGFAVGDRYPTGPENNDPQLPTPPCQGEATDFVVGPDGRLLYRCPGHGTRLGYYFDPTGLAYDGGATLIHLTYDNLALTGVGGSIIDLETHESADVYGLPPRDDFEVITIRSTPPADFWLVLRDLSTDRLSRWRIDASGAAYEEVAYAGDPPNGKNTWFSAALDGSGNLFSVGIENRSGTHVLILYQRDGSKSEVVFAEAHTTLKIYNVGLVTGP